MLYFRLLIGVFLQLVLSAIALTSSAAFAQTDEFDDVFAYGGDMCHTHTTLLSGRYVESKVP